MIRHSDEPKLRLSSALFKGSLIHNPVLTQLIGVCPIVAAATKVRDALALSLMLTLLICVNEVLTSLFLRKIKRWQRICLYTLISSILIAVCEPLIFKITGNSGAGLGIYLYLLCVNALIVIRCESFACRADVRSSFLDGLAAGIGYGAIALIVAAVRELINYGGLFTSFDTAPRISASAMPFIALVIIGFLAAAHKWILIRFYPDETRDTFSLRKVNEKTVFLDPGLSVGKKNTAASRDIRPRHMPDEDFSAKGGNE